jgi:hypothetical protein
MYLHTNNVAHDNIIEMSNPTYVSALPEPSSGVTVIRCPLFSHSICWLEQVSGFHCNLGSRHYDTITVMTFVVRFAGYIVVERRWWSMSKQTKFSPVWEVCSAVLWGFLRPSAVITIVLKANVKLFFCYNTQRCEDVWGSLGKAPRTCILSLGTRWRWLSA